MKRDDQAALKLILQRLDKKRLPHTYQNIGNEIGMTRQGAHVRYAKYMPEKVWPSQPFVDELRSKDVSGLNAREIYEIYGPMFNLSKMSVIRNLNYYSIPHSYATGQIDEFLEALKAVDTRQLTASEIIESVVPDTVNKKTATRYLYTPEFRRKHNISIKPQRSSFQDE